MKFVAVSVALQLSLISGAFAALPHVGFYQTIDDETNAPKSIVCLYEYADGDNASLAGRIVALYDKSGKIVETMAAPVKIAEKVSGAPHYAGMDIIWNMRWNDGANKFENGKIMDPTSGKVYSSVIWADNGKLNVRGKIGPFGRTQVWNVLGTDNLPAALRNINIENWKPVIRK